MTRRQLANRRYYRTNRLQILAQVTARRRALGALPRHSPELAQRESIRRMPARRGHCSRCGIDCVPCPYCAQELGVAS